HALPSFPTRRSSDLYDLGFSDEVERSIVELLSRSPATRDMDQAASVFTRVLSSPKGAHPILQLMADLGILGWILPEVGEILNLIDRKSTRLNSSHVA